MGLQELPNQALHLDLWSYNWFWSWSGIKEVNDHRIRMWVGLKNKGGCSFRYSLLGTSLFCTMKETIKGVFFFHLHFVFNETWFSHLFRDFKLHMKSPRTWSYKRKTILNYVSVNAAERNIIQENLCAPSLGTFFSWGSQKHREMSGLYLTLWILIKVTIITVLMSRQEKRSSHMDKPKRSVTVG